MTRLEGTACAAAVYEAGIEVLSLRLRPGVAESLIVNGIMDLMGESRTRD
jgi:hypothetical protein